MFYKKYDDDISRSMLSSQKFDLDGIITEEEKTKRAIA
jgi:hypothetical protein